MAHVEHQRGHVAVRRAHVRTRRPRRPRAYTGLVRIAVLADIHGNLPALEAVLADAASHAVDEIVVNGDLVNRGPQGSQVVHRLLGLQARLLMGNHDDYLRMIVDHDPNLPEAYFGGFWQGNVWCAQELQEHAALDPLRDLPMTHRVERPGAPRLLLSHGSPRHYREGYTERMPDEVVSEIIEMHPADVLVGSHTHHQLHRRWGRFQVMNTGAVGTPFNGDGRAQYLWLTLEDGAWVPTFRRVAYDVGSALSAYADSGYLEEGGLIARLFHDEVRDARAYMAPYLMWAEAAGHVLGEESFERFRAGHPQRFAPPRPWPDRTESVRP